MYSLALADACRRGDLAEVGRRLGAAGDPAAAARANDNEALRAACIGGHLAVVDRLLARDVGLTAADARACDNEALRAAAADGRLAIVRRLLGLGLGPADARAAACEAPRLALALGHLDVLDALLPGLTADDVRARDNAMLRDACEGGHLAVVGRLLAAGLTPDDVGVYRHLPLVLAARGGHVAVVELLVFGSPAAPRYRGLTSEHVRSCKALAAAAGYGHAEIVRLLAGGRADAPSYRGLTAEDVRASGALRAAADGRHAGAVAALLDAGLALGDARECKLFAYACGAGDLALAERLAAMGLTAADVRADDYEALRLAMRHPGPEGGAGPLVWLAVDLGLEADDVRAAGHSLLLHACRARDFELVGRLAGLGLTADDMRVHRHLPLRAAIRCGVEAVDLVIGLGLTAQDVCEEIISDAIRDAAYGGVAAAVPEALVALGAAPSARCLRFAPHAFADPAALWRVLGAWEGSAELAAAEAELARLWRDEFAAWEAAKAAARDAAPSWARFAD